MQHQKETKQNKTKQKENTPSYEITTTTGTESTTTTTATTTTTNEWKNSKVVVVPPIDVFNTVIFEIPFQSGEKVVFKSKLGQSVDELLADIKDERLCKNFVITPKNNEKIRTVLDLLSNDFDVSIDGHTLTVDTSLLKGFHN